MAPSRLLNLVPGRSPHGERGLKYLPPRAMLILTPSLPTRGAWIEIDSKTLNALLIGRSPHGERGLKYVTHK